MRDEIKVLNGRPYPMGLSVTGEREINLAAVLHAKEECGVILYPKREAAGDISHSGRRTGSEISAV